MRQGFKVGLCLVLIGRFLPVSADEIIISGDIWCPVNCNPSDPDPGYMVEIAKLALEVEGHKVTYRPMAWKRAITEVKEGKVNATIGGYLEDTPDFVFPEEEEGMIGMKFFVVKQSRWQYRAISSLENVSLGAVQDYSYLDVIDRYITENSSKNVAGSDPKNPRKRVQLTGGNGALIANMEKLKLGRIDVLIESDVVFRYTSRQKYAGEFKEVGAPAPAAKAYLAFSPATSQKQQSIKYAALVSKAMIKMRKDGSLARLLQKYGLNDWK